jgi:predicted GH43/DUF377 family glycosyl hydrolase
MKWKKKGAIFENQLSLDWAVTHAAVPIADNIDGDMFRVYFSTRDNLNRSQTGFFVIDINHPNKILYHSSLPVLAFGGLGMFDESGAMGSWVVDWNSTKYLYYIGWNLGRTVPFRNALGLALSNDGGKMFVKQFEGPIMDRNIIDPFFTASPCVLFERDRWRMWYVSCVKWEMSDNTPKHYYHIKYAESLDGIHWQRNGIVCIDFKSQDEYAISRPCVIRENNLYRMWYSCRGMTYRIGYAESTDGISWERKDNDVGIDVSESGWDSEMIEYPFVFDHKGQRYMLYNGNGYGKTGIGLAILEQ